MTHAAPRARAIDERRGTPDVFGARAHRAAKVALPLVLGFLYGCWAATNQRHDRPVTGGNVLFGVITGLVFAVLLAALLAAAPKLRPGPHTLAWAAFSGVATGFLISQSPMDAVWSAGLGLAVALGVLAALSYHVATRRGAKGDRAG